MLVSIHPRTIISDSLEFGGTRAFLSASDMELSYNRKAEKTAKRDLERGGFFRERRKKRDFPQAGGCAPSRLSGGGSVGTRRWLVSGISLKRAAARRPVFRGRFGRFCKAKHRPHFKSLTQ